MCDLVHSDLNQKSQEVWNAVFHTETHNEGGHKLSAGWAHVTSPKPSYRLTPNYYQFLWSRTKKKGVLAKGVSAESIVTAKETKNTQGYTFCKKPF